MLQCGHRVICMIAAITYGIINASVEKGKEWVHLSFYIVWTSLFLH